ncbi:hypothetical protein BLNAU_21116 [Blattamonas nauphoetae]|uniref:Uncharacterized protein n=1 Tax=Blattamonas nauphoetae TaxID=2049346 RepID=A0ABQ9WWR8_9EUKA|nr:hypothetical protein BLNAU_21116 [Blattamonas nauphoetae]
MMAFIKDGGIFDNDTTTRATTLLRHISPSFGNIFKAEQILFELVPTKDRSCCGFTENILTLLTCGNEDLVRGALGILESSTPSVAAEFDMAEDEVHKLLLDKVTSPMQPFIVSVCRNRYRIRDAYKSYHLSQLIGSLFQNATFFTQTLRTILSLPISLCFVSCLAFFSHGSLTWHFLYELGQLFEWWLEDGTSEDKERGEMLVRDLREEDDPVTADSVAQAFLSLVSIVRDGFIFDEELVSQASLFRNRRLSLWQFADHEILHFLAAQKPGQQILVTLREGGVSDESELLFRWSWFDEVEICTTVLVAPDISASSDTIGCGTTVMPCKTIAFGLTQFQTTTNAGYRIEIGGSSTCKEVGTILVDNPVDFLGQSRNATIGGDGYPDGLESMLTLKSTSTFSSLTLLRTHRWSFATLSEGTNVVFMECTFGFLSEDTKEKTVHPPLLQMNGGHLTIAECALASCTGSQSITLLNISGGSLSITDQVFSNFKRLHSSPSILKYKAKTIQLRDHFQEGQVIIKNTKINNAKYAWDYSVIIEGYDFPNFVTPAAFAGTIPSYDQLTPALANDFMARDEYFNCKPYTLPQVLYPYKQGPMHLHKHVGVDNKYCGQKNTPCKAFTHVFDKLKEGSASIVLLSDAEVKNEHSTNNSLTTIEGAMGIELPELRFTMWGVLTVKPGTALEGRRFKMSIGGFTSINGFVVQGQLRLTTVHFELLDKTHIGAVNVAGGMVMIKNATSTPSSRMVRTQLLNVSRGSVSLSDAILGGSAEKKMMTDEGILVFVQSGVLGIENTTFQHIEKEAGGDGGVLVSLGGTIGLRNVVFIDCTAPTRAHCVLVSRSSFSADTVQMLNVSFSDGTTKKLNESVVLFGSNVRTTVNAKSFAGTLKPMRDTPEADKMVLVGQESTGSTVFPLALFVTGSNEEAEDESEFVLLSLNENEF